jgi:hypothetical protein
VSQFKYRGRTVTNQNFIHDEIRRRLNSGNTCYHSVQNFLSSHLLFKNIKIRIQKTAILPLVLYEGEPWSLTVTEEQRLKLCENRALRCTFGPERNDVMAGWRKLHNKELRDLYSSPSIIRMLKSRRMRWADHAAQIGEETKMSRLLVGKPEGKRPLGRPGCR